jgi:hypothetical protein
VILIDIDMILLEADINVILLRGRISAGEVIPASDGYDMAIPDE